MFSSVSSYHFCQYVTFIVITCGMYLCAWNAQYST